MKMLSVTSKAEVDNKGYFLFYCSMGQVNEAKLKKMRRK